MELRQCPFDGTPVTVENLSGGSLLLSCDTCGAAWEWHGAWIGRVHDPDPEKIRPDASTLRVGRN